MSVTTNVSFTPYLGGLGGGLGLEPSTKPILYDLPLSSNTRYSGAWGSPLLLVYQFGYYTSLYKKLS